MTAPTRHERDLPRLLTQLVEGTRPDYRDSIVEATARTAQRPAWTFPGRWLPMDITVRRVAGTSVSRLPVLLLIAALLIAAATITLFAASRPKVPAPFGPAANGIVVYGSGGDLYAMDADGGNARPFIADPVTNDGWPLFSNQGDRVAFARESGGAHELWLSNGDGQAARRLTGPLVGLGAFAWSPDGSQLAVHHRVSGMDTVTLFATDGSRAQDLELPFPAGDPLWRPGHPGQLLVRTQGLPVYDLYVVDVAAGTQTKLDLPHEDIPNAQYDGQRPDWSPDGSRLLVEQGLARFSDAGRPVIRLRVVDVSPEGTATASRLLEQQPGADYEYGATWLTTGAGFGFAMQAGCTFQVFVTSGEDIAGATPAGDPIDDCANLGVGITLAPDATRAVSTRSGPDGEVMSLGGIDGSDRTRLDGSPMEGLTWQRVVP